MGTRWRGMLAPLNTPTGDGRRFAASGITHRELPLALKWQRQDEVGHDTSVVIGSMDTIDVRSDAVWGEGELFDDVDPQEMRRLHEDVCEAKLLLKKRVIGPSVDAGAATAVIVEKGSDEPLTDERLDELFMDAYDSGEDVELELLFVEYQIAAATLVPVPAFEECRPFELLDAEPVTEPVMALTAAVRTTGWADLPFAARDREWDSAAADRRLSQACGIGGDNPDWGRYAAAHLYKDDEADPETKGAYGFLIVDVVDDQEVIVPRAVFSVAGVLQGARGGTDISADDQETMRGVVSGLYDRMREEFDDDTIIAPWEQESAASLSAASRYASLTAAATNPRVDPAWFDDPNLPAYTLPTTLDDPETGLVRVFGHIAAHDVCHVGFSDVCMTAPYSTRGYVDFHRYTRTTTGLDLPVPAGRLTTGHGSLTDSCACCRRNDDHACARLSYGAAIAHHDRMNTVAYIRVGEDERNGAIWFAGILHPDATAADRAAYDRQRVSGDWREVSGNLELTEVLVLSREDPGFPPPRTRIHGRSQYSLTAAGTPRPGRPVVETLTVDVDRLANTLAARVVAALTVPSTVIPTPDTDDGDPPAVDPRVEYGEQATQLAQQIIDTCTGHEAGVRARTAAALIREIGDL